MIHINRFIEKRLEAWSRDSARKVLLLRGARQVGKTYAVRRHAKHRYKHLLEINFLTDKKISSFFQGDIDIDVIVEALEAMYAVPLRGEETLLFFDEIQECPEALQSLRFFYEKRPDLHVVATGSLLEFAIELTSSFGVGRIQSLFMHPVSFDEYLSAAGEEQLLSVLAKSGPQRQCLGPIHEKLMCLLKTYIYLGGLPEVVRKFIEHHDYQSVQHSIDSLRTGFEDDFAKYRKRTPHTRLQEVFRSASLQAGKKFVHTHAYPDANAGSVHDALELLNKAGIVHKIFHSAANGVPLGGEINIKKFKVMPFDHGIYQRMIGVTPSEVIQRDFNPINKGALAEVYVGCALVAHSSPLSRPELFYWHREAKSSNAEVDYLLQWKDKIIPIEVKSATKGTMQSMKAFLREKGREGKLAPCGIRLSLENFGKFENIVTIPLYAVSQIERILAEM